MTREEAIAYFKYNRKIFCEDYLKICPKDSIAYQATLKEKEFYDMAIKSLEQEPILDKIRSEVTALKSHHINDRYDDGFQGCRIEVLDILNKCKAESEDNNGNDD